MRTDRILNTFFTFAFAGVAAIAVVYLYQNYQELTEMRGKEERAQERLQQLESEVKAGEGALAKLHDDPKYIEIAIRKKLGYAKQGETVFRFD